MNRRMQLRAVATRYDCACHYRVTVQISDVLRASRPLTLPARRRCASDEAELDSDVLEDLQVLIGTHEVEP
jgi:hypothetical protein